MNIGVDMLEMEPLLMMIGITKGHSHRFGTKVQELLAQVIQSCSAMRILLTLICQHKQSVMQD